MRAFAWRGAALIVGSLLFSPLGRAQPVAPVTEIAPTAGPPVAPVTGAPAPVATAAAAPSASLSAPETPLTAPELPAVPNVDASSCSAASPELGDADVGCLKRPAINSDEVPDVAGLKTPESPAFMMLGSAPSEIQRPSTPTGVAVSLANGFANGRGLSPFRNFALVFAPYWLVGHPTVAFERLQDEPEWAWLRNLSLSLASGDESVVSETDGEATLETRLAKASAGLRVTVWPGHPSRGAQQCLTYLQSRLDEVTLNASTKHRDFLEEYVLTHPEPQPPPRRPDPVDPNDAAQVAEWKRAGAADRAEFERRYATWFAKYELARAQATEEGTDSLSADPRYASCLETMHAKSGFMAELAVAGLLALPDADLKLLDDGGTRSVASWLTFGYVAESMLGRRSEGSVFWVLRGEHGQGSVTTPDRTSQRLDAGMRLATALHRTGIAVEGTVRHQRYSDRDEEWLYRAALSVDYHLQGGMWLSATFGKDFGDTKEQTPLLALANLQWSFGLDRNVEIDRKATQ